MSETIQNETHHADQRIDAQAQSGQIRTDVLREFKQENEDFIRQKVKEDMDVSATLVFEIKDNYM